MNKLFYLTVVVLYFVDDDNFEMLFEFLLLLFVLYDIDFLFLDVFVLILFDDDKDVLVLDEILIDL